MGAAVVTVGRHRYAVGLYWENSPGSGRVAQTAKEAAAQPGQQADFYAVRPGNKNGRIPQFGLCTAEAGQTPGMPVLVGCLATQVPGSWVGAFRVREGIVVTVIRDDLVVPDGDLFFHDEAEARDRLTQEVGFGGLQAVYAPEAWAIPGSDTIPLQLLLNDRRDIKLQRVKIQTKTKILTFSLVGVVCLLLAIGWYWNQKIEEENLRRGQQEEAMHRAQEAAKKLVPGILQQETAPEPKYDRKWETSPPALDIIESCRQGLAKVHLVAIGWRLSALKCGNGGMVATWAREKGASRPPEYAKVNETITQAIQTIALPPLPPRGEEALGDPDELTRRYLAQNWSGSLARAPDDPLPPPPPGYTGSWTPSPPPWLKRSFTLSVPELPSGIPGLIGGLPGVVINNISFSPSGISGVWVVEGTIYENRK